jgi:hypothetical protein
MYVKFEVGDEVECIEECTCPNVGCAISHIHNPVGKTFTVVKAEDGLVWLDKTKYDYSNSDRKFKLIENDKTDLSDWI